MSQVLRKVFTRDELVQILAAEMARRCDVSLPAGTNVQITISKIYPKGGTGSTVEIRVEVEL